MLSKNGVGLIVLALSLLGINITESNLIEVISAVGTIASFIMMIINQVKREDVKYFFFKK
jgi:hypothetical protein